MPRGPAPPPPARWHGRHCWHARRAARASQGGGASSSREIPALGRADVEPGAGVEFAAHAASAERGAEQRRELEDAVGAAGEQFGAVDAETREREALAAGLDDAALVEHEVAARVVSGIGHQHQVREIVGLQARRAGGRRGSRSRRRRSARRMQTARAAAMHGRSRHRFRAARGLRRCTAVARRKHCRRRAPPGSGRRARRR